jgi:proton-dependent oligopeptide transporter, POT family
MAKDQGSEFSDSRIEAFTSGNGAGQAAGMAAQHDFFGHPRGLSTLFFTELWERFSYYGMRALLVLYMTRATFETNPGLGFDVATAGAVYGLYTFFVYVLALPGGWVADNLWGQRKAVFVGGCIIAAGHFSMAVPTTATFFLGLALIAIGTGLLKPNVSTMVGEMYPEGGARRDAGFSVFYMGINLGAILGPTLCGILGEGYNWHLGFSLAGVGMVLGLIWYKAGGKYLGDAGLLRTDDDAATLARKSRTFYLITAVLAAVVVLIIFLTTTGALGITLEQMAGGLGVVAVIITLAFFAYIIFLGGHSAEDKKRLGVIFWLFILAALFWSGFEQAGSSMNLFAADLTDRTYGPYTWLSGLGILIPVLIVGIPLGFAILRISKRANLWWVGKAAVTVLALLLLALVIYVAVQTENEWVMPASLLQNINPLFIVIFAPLFGGLWTWLANRNANPSIPAKFALGLFGLSAGFFVLSWGAANATAENPVTPAWLVVTYFLHTVGELCLSPVGLSSMTKLAPRNRVGQMMGIWFVASALGNLFAGLIAGRLEDLAPNVLFGNVAVIVGGAGLIALLASPFVRKFTGGIK